MDVELGKMNVELEGRFSYVRTQETNLGNFITDIMLAAVNADCAFINSGSLRSDCVHSKGVFKVRDLKKILPFLNHIFVLKVTGNLFGILDQ
jgi:5'-nucleotidase